MRRRDWRSMLRRPSWRIPIILGLLLFVFGVIGLRPVFQNARLLNRVEELGGDFYSHHYGWVRYVPYKWQRKLRASIMPRVEPLLGEGWVGRFKHINGIDLRNTRARDDDLRLLRGQRYIGWMWLSNTDITDDGLAYVGELDLNNYLHLEETGITSDGLAHLAGLDKLRSLILSDTLVGDEGLHHLSKMKNLERLILSGTLVSDTGVEELKKHLPKCYIYRRE